MVVTLSPIDTLVRLGQDSNARFPMLVTLLPINTLVRLVQLKNAPSLRTLAYEAIPMAAFIGLAVVGYKRSGWLVAAGLIGHAIFDSFHHHLIENTGMPVWWPGFCLSINYTLGAFLVYYLFRARKSGNLS